MRQRAAIFLLAISYLGFVSLGLPDGLLGVATPSILGRFARAPGALGSLLVCFALGYLVSGSASGWLLARMRVGTLLLASCLVTGASLLGMAAAPAWPLLVALGFPSGLGAGAIDAGLNTHVATHHSARTLNWIHACYGIGAAGGTALMTAVLGDGRPWQAGYALVAGGQLALAGIFALTLPRWPTPSGRSEVAGARSAAPSATLRLPAAWLGIATFAVYVGLEAAIGVWTFSLLTSTRGVPMSAAGTGVTVYWASLTIGRLAVGFVANRIPAHRLLRSCTIGAVLACSMIATDAPPALGFSGLALAGLALAPIFPSLIAATPARLGPAHAANGIGFQIAGAVVGQSLVPWAVGVAAGRFGVAAIGPALVVAAAALLLVHEASIAARARTGGADESQHDPTTPEVAGAGQYDTAP